MEQQKPQHPQPEPLLPAPDAVYTEKQRKTRVEVDEMDKRRGMPPTGNVEEIAASGLAAAVKPEDSR